MTSVAVSATGIDLPAWSGRCKIFAERVVAAIGTVSFEVSIVLCSNGYIRSLNRTYRGLDEPTDVLSFSQYDDLRAVDVTHEAQLIPAGDIVISLEAAAENAQDFGVDLEEEVKRLIIHGILHLLGWHHTDNSPNQEMLKLQETILTELRGERLL